MNKRQQEEQRRQEDLALKQGMLWAAGAVVLEVLLFFINRYAFDFDATAQGVALAESLRGVLKAMRWVGLAGFVGGGVLMGAQVKKGGKLLWAAVACIAGAAVMLCAHVAVKYQATGLRMLYLLVPVLGGLALSYFIYQKEFFLAALPVVMAVLGLWFVRVGGICPEMLATILICAAVVIAVLKLKKGNGALKLGEKTQQVLPEKTNYTVALATAAIAVAVQALAAVAGGVVAYYLIFVMGAWLFALLVYYTVKML